MKTLLDSQSSSYQEILKKLMIKKTLSFIFLAYSDNSQLIFYLAFLLQTLEKCQHFLPSKDVRLKLLILDVIELSVQALKQQQKDLLPSVHKIWPSIVERIKDTDHVNILDFYPSS